MKTLAIGRICQDEFYAVRSATDRIASTKLTADYIGRQFGGSVFSEAKMLSSAGVDCTFLSCMAKGDVCKVDEPISLKIIETPTTPRSFIYLNQQNKLDKIYSVSETEVEKILPTPALLDEIEKEISPGRLLYDLRQTALVEAVLERIGKKVALTVLDPGSAPFLGISEAARKQKENIIAQSNVICAGHNFYEYHARYSRLSDYFTCSAFRSAELLIATLSDGRNVFAAKDFCFTVYRLNQLSIGNTMGAGDAFRGAFLAFWQETRDRMTYDAVLCAAKMAVAAATLKIEDGDPIPKMPKMDSVRQKADRLTYRITAVDSLV